MHDSRGQGSELARRIATRLACLRQRAQLRELAVTAGIDFCSNDYLGLADHPVVKNGLVNAIERSERLAATGSRLVSGHHPAWDALEAKFADFAGTEASLYFSSGFAANLRILS